MRTRRPFTFIEPVTRDWGAVARIAGWLFVANIAAVAGLFLVMFP